MAATLLAAVALLGATALPAQAAPGDADPSFGRAGLVVSPSGVAHALTVQPDGKLVAAGDVSPGLGGSELRLARYGTDGAPDPGFGTEGVVTTPHLAFGLTASDEHAEALAIQAADGKLVVAGSATDVNGVDFALARYNPDGTLDETFGSGGTVVTDFAGETDTAKTMTIQPDGKIVVAGFAGPGDPAVFAALAVARYNADGTLDETFGGTGKVVTPVPGSSESSVEAVVLDGVARIVVAGTSLLDTGSAIVLARYSPTGVLDTSFGVGGIRLTQPPEGEAGATALLIQNRRPVVAGSRSGAAPGFLLARYRANGALDTTFGSGGLVTTTFGTREFAGANALVQDSDGRLVAAGTVAAADPEAGSDFALARYGAGGLLDASFGDGGTVIDDLGASDEAQALRLQADGKPVVAGFRDAFFALTRYASAAGGEAADLELSMAAAPEPISAGAVLRYTITVANNGPGDAAGIVATATLGTDSTFELAQSDQGFCTASAGTVRCNLRALLPGRSATVTIDVIPTRAGTLTASVGVTASTADPSAANNGTVTSSTVTAAEGSWSPASSFSDGIARVFHAATVLAGGGVLVSGGQGSDFAPLASAQRYAGAAWAPTIEPLDLPRHGHTATLLAGAPSACGTNCGKVLVTGGTGADGVASVSAELYDPATGAWTPTGDLSTARARHTATLLPNGKVLVVGGVGADSGATGESVNQAELYDPVSGRWTAAAAGVFGRQGHTATLLPSGKVLAVGGYRGTKHDSDPTGPLAPPELYDPQLDAWSGAGDHIRRWEHTATLLANGTVLVVGGNGSSCACPTSAIEIYDPADGPAGSWRLTGLLARSRSSHTATLLRDGEVLVAGGAGQNSSSSLRSAELVDPATGQRRSGGVMDVGRAGHTASLLGDGSVLVAGGSSAQFGVVPLASAERYTPAVRPAAAAVAAARPPSASVTGGAGAGASPARDTIAPRITSFSMSRSRFRVARGATSGRGSAFRYTLSEPATVRIAIERRVPGLRLQPGRAAPTRCVPATQRNSRLLTRRLERTLPRGLGERERTRRLARLTSARRCIRLQPTGALSRAARQGSNRLRFRGHVAGHALQQGRYVATIRATDVAGNRSRTKRTTFQIVG